MCIRPRQFPQTANGTPTSLLEQLREVETPTLRWVKDNKVLDLYVPDMDKATFLERTGLQCSPNNGEFVLSKRISRIMRPYRYATFFDAHTVTIDYNAFLDGRLWDGCGQVSRHFVQRLADRLDLDARQRQTLLHCNRLEVTTLHAGVKIKGTFTW